MLTSTPLTVLLLAAVASVISTPVPGLTSAPILAPTSEESVSVTLKARDKYDIIEVIDIISYKMAVLNASTTDFEPGVVQSMNALNIVVDSNDLESTVEQATDVVNQSDQLDKSDSISVGLILVALSNQVCSSLDNMVAKKPEFDKAILGLLSASPIVGDLLVSLRLATQDFSGALITKLDPSLQALAPMVTNKIDAAFETAINTFYYS